MPRPAQTIKANRFIATPLTSRPSTAALSGGNQVGPTPPCCSTRPPCRGEFNAMRFRATGSEQRGQFPQTPRKLSPLLAPHCSAPHPTEVESAVLSAECDEKCPAGCDDQFAFSLSALRS